MILPNDTDLISDATIRLYFRANGIRVVGGMRKIYYSLDDLCAAVGTDNIRWTRPKYMPVIHANITMIDHKDAMRLLVTSVGNKATEMFTWMFAVNRLRKLIWKKERSIQSLENSFYMT